jgi:DNA ligase (NAD+)
MNVLSIRASNIRKFSAPLSLINYSLRFYTNKQSSSHKKSTQIDVGEFTMLRKILSERFLTNNKLKDKIDAICAQYFNGSKGALSNHFAYTGLNPEFFKFICELQKLRRTYTHRYTKQRELDPSDIEFVPSQQDGVPENCVAALKEHIERFKNGKSRITNFEFNLLIRKLRTFSEKLRENNALRDLLGSITMETEPIFSMMELNSFFDGVQNSLGASPRDFLFSPIINGVPIKLTYIDGVLNSAVATGFAKEQDIIDLIRKMSKIPQIIKDTKSVITVFGHLFLHISDFNRLNLERKRNGQQYWIDTRTAIAHAILNSEEPNKTLELKLRSCFERYTTSSNNEEKSLSAIIQYLACKGFPVIHNRKYTMRGDGMLYKDMPDILTRFAQLSFENDGILIQVNNINERKILKAKDCRYHFVPQFNTTKITRIDHKVLPEGLIISIIYIEPINIGGKTISTFSINNKSSFLESDIRVDDQVIISSQPNMPPRFLRSLKNSLSPIVEFPTSCPKCNAALSEIQASDGTLVAYCSTHLSCVNDSLGSVAHFCGRCGLNIPSMSNSVISELIKKFKIVSIADIFLLSAGDYDSMESISFEDFEKLLMEIQAARHTTLQRFIYALNIPTITFLMAEELSYMAGTIDRLSKMAPEEFSGSEYLSKQNIKNIQAFFADSKRRREIEDLLANGVIISEPSKEMMKLCYKKLDSYTVDDYKAVVQKIKECNRNYSVSDYEFDLLNKTAKRIEDLHPEWTISRLPAENHKRELVDREDPIRKLTKTYFAGELKRFCEAIKDADIVVEPKVNGVACMLEYTNGELKHAFTRHDGKRGYDVSDYIMNIQNVPKKLRENFSGMVRGELFFLDKDFKQINSERLRSGLGPYIDALSLVVGSLSSKRNTPQIYSGIQFYAYLVVASKLSQSDLHGYLKKLGFNNPHVPFKLFQSADSAVKYATDISARRNEFPMNIDGMVLKANVSSPKIDKKYPMSACAYKFQLETLTTTLQKVNFNLTQTGVLSAVAEIKPITFSNNRTAYRLYIRDNRILRTLCEGDTLSVCYSGGTVPVLHSVKEGKRSAEAVPIEIPTNCPTCNQVLTHKKCGTLQCTNERCGGVSLPSILHFAATMKIGNPSVIQELVSVGLISKISDFYTLLPEDLCDNTSLSPEEIQPLYLSMECSKNNPFSQFLMALNIDGIGEISAKQIATAFPSLAELSRATSQDLQISGIKIHIAEKIVQYFRSNKDEIAALIKFGILKNADQNNIEQPAALPDWRQISHSFKERESGVSNLIKTVLDVMEKNTVANRQDLLALSEARSIETDRRELDRLVYQIQRTWKNNTKLSSIMKQYLINATSPPPSN